jgi:hypothetical protein
MRRFYKPNEVDRVSQALAYSHPDIAQAVGEDSEMVEGGYIADLTSKQMAVLATAYLPTGRALKPTDEQATP